MSLTDDVLEQVAARSVEPQVADLVVAALAGEGALDAVLSGGEAARPAEAATTSTGAPAAYLMSIDVAGFRGIGPPARLELKPGPGLTVVVGRNGSGKSSFAEALEVLLTGDSFRWRNKSAVWKQGWRNLHAPAGASVSAAFAVEGSTRPTLVTRSWDDGATEAADAGTVVEAHGHPTTDLTGFGWQDAVSLYRPLLSHPELGVVADDPSKLFDALAAVLGLDELVEATALLAKRRQEASKSLTAVRKRIKDALLPALEESEDERAAAVSSALGGRSWDLDSAEENAAGVAPAPSGVEALNALALLRPPDAEVVESAATQIESAAATVATLQGSESGRSRRTADLLETALAEHAEHGDQPCPVCGAGGLDAGWRARAEAQVAELRRAASEYDDAVKTLKAAVGRGRDLIRPVPAPLADPPDGVDATAARHAWQTWAEAPDDGDLADHLRDSYPSMAEAVALVAKQAAALREEREDAWRPLALQVLDVVHAARRALTDDERAKQLKESETALTAITEELRSRRFQPIANHAIDLWKSLRLQSNVDLTAVELRGRGNRRSVDLSVEVDGTEGAALGVVSQGEVNCLALSLFFPRAMLPESPFRFIVIDDPVQAMDPARVDGLAEVFATVAATRQLVVFTHDDRLPASLQRLGLAHTALEVTRRPGSEVRVRPIVDPVNRYFLDAKAVGKDDSLPDAVASRVVPGLCRLGVEAACMEAVRRRRIGRGDSHADVEEALAELKGTTAFAAMALFDDAGAGGKVLGEINARWGRDSGDAFKACNAGAHTGFSGSLLSLVDEAKKLAAGLRAAK